MSISIPFHYLAIAAILMGLAFFGYFYNNAVARKMREGYTDDVWLFVVIGVAVTLTGAALRDPEGALWTLICFGASGAYMIYGSIGRRVAKKQIKAERAQLAIITALEDLNKDATAKR